MRGRWDEAPRARRTRSWTWNDATRRFEKLRKGHAFAALARPHGSESKHFAYRLGIAALLHQAGALRIHMLACTEVMAHKAGVNVGRTVERRRRLIPQPVRYRRSLVTAELACLWPPLRLRLCEDRSIALRAQSVSADFGCTGYTGYIVAPVTPFHWLHRCTNCVIRNRIGCTVTPALPAQPA